MLEIRDLHVGYGMVKALSGVSITAEAGSITAVLGANGAGKTTLLRTINGLVPVRSGSIVLDGEDITNRSVERIVRLGVAQVPEGRGVITELTVEENLRLGGLWRRGGSKPSELDAVYDSFPPLSSRRKQPAETLSGGERQMLAIGRALLSRPRLLLLDEPSLGLAPRITAQIMGTLKDLQAAQGLTVLLVEQNARSALSIADRGVVLYLGKVAAADAADKLAGEDQLRHAYLGF